MPISLTITDITRMTHNFICVAGIDASGRTIRLQYRTHRITDDWCKLDGHYIKPFTRIELNLEVPRPVPPHTEDWYVIDEKPRFLEYCSSEEKHKLLEDSCEHNVASIFGAEILHTEKEGFYIQSGTGYRSLGTIKASSPYFFKHQEFQKGWDYRLTFADLANNAYRLKIVDLSFQTFIDHLRICIKQSENQIGKFISSKVLLNQEVFLRIGLSRNWGIHPDRCFLQITGVYTFPDYLENRSFHFYRWEIDKGVK